MVLHQIEDELHRKLLARVPAVEGIVVVRHEEQPPVVRTGRFTTGAENPRRMDGTGSSGSENTKVSRCS